MRTVYIHYRYIWKQNSTVLSFHRIEVAIANEHVNEQLIRTH